MPIRSVVEFGGGLWSTGAFLNRSRFPLLESLTTFEHDGTWAEKIRTNDSRHKIIVIGSGKFASASADMRADFVFLDSGPAMSDRMTLVPHALTVAPIFAIHDCQENELHTYGFKYLRGFNGIIQTVFASNTIDLSGIMLA